LAPRDSWTKGLAGWIRNFGYWFGACVALAGAIGAIGQTSLFQNVENVEIMVALLGISLVLGFVICYPFVGEQKAQGILNTKIQTDMKVGTTTVSVAFHEAKLDAWTWHIKGGIATSAGILHFSSQVNAKTGAVRKLDWFP
jgi:hypothetical protein